MKLTVDRINSEKAIFAGLLSFVIIIKLTTLFEYGFQYVGNDDQIFWLCASDYANGIFHEPYFYGQNYNYAFESFISVPLIALGIPFHIALPLISAFLGVFPFLLFSILLYNKGYSINAFIVLLIPITLPIEYDIITTITRGFTSGLFFSSFAIYSLLNPHKKVSFLILGLSVSTGYIMNPNSLIFSFPICLYLLFKNYKSVWFYFVSLIPVLPILFLQYYSKEFYVNNPEYNVHSMWTLDFSFERLISGFSKLDMLFRYLTPIFWKGNWMALVGIIVFGIISVKTNWKKGLSLLLCSLFIILLMGINKIHDDIGVIFLSSTRMFLAIPLVLGLAVFWTKNDFLDKKRWTLIVVTIAISVFFVKISAITTTVSAHTIKKDFGPVAINDLDNLKLECAEIQELTSKHNVDLVVFIPSWEINVPQMEF